MEKVLSVVCFLGAVASISLLVSLIVVLVKDDEDVVKPEDVVEMCLTQTCIEESSKVLAQMNQEADPYGVELLFFIVFLSYRNHFLLFS